LNVKSNHVLFFSLKSNEWTDIIHFLYQEVQFPPKTKVSQSNRIAVRPLTLYKKTSSINLIKFHNNLCNQLDTTQQKKGKGIIQIWWVHQGKMASCCIAGPGNPATRIPTPQDNPS